MGEIVRKTPAEVRSAVTAGRALLVCGYDSEETFSSMQLEQSISWSQFLKLLPRLDKGQEIVFYCA